LRPPQRAARRQEVGGMIRTTITIDESLAQEIDRYVASANVSNRSEAIRDLVRRGLSAMPQTPAGADCIGVISCTVDQSMPELSRRLREARMGRHSEIMFAASVPINHHETIDLAVVRGSADRVGDYARSLFLERGVRHGALALTPTLVEVEHHAHAEGETPHAHVHIKVREGF
jgi:CopG family nickel-responsive transcriptional regulator